MPKIMKLYKLIFIMMFIGYIGAIGAEYLTVIPKSGDGLRTLFDRYMLDYNTESLNRFVALNSSKLGKNNSLFLGREYELPIKKYEYNGTSIRSTINNFDYDYAVTIQDYNDILFSKGIKSNNYRVDKELWVPEVSFITASVNTTSTSGNNGNNSSRKENELKSFEVPLFGNNHKKVTEISHKLKNNIYYLVGGHGGPDPGAIGHRYNNTLHEDEYAYDIVLRLAKNLMEHGATVKIIVQDPNDGIRDDYYLNNSYDEVYMGDEEIPLNQLQRLKKRVEIINREYNKNKDNFKEHIVVPIHVDSRENKNSRIDIFFYYNQYSERGKYIATTLMETLEAKYNAAQPGRGYTGSCSSRGLYMIRNTLPVSVYIELGNIQNERDQIRLVEKNNRQAIANWLTDGFLKLVE